MIALDDAIAALPALELHTTQAEYDAWYGEATAMAADRANPVHFADVNDGVLNFAALCAMVKKHPELHERAQEVCSEVVAAGMGSLGMRAGSGNIAKLLGLDIEEVWDAMINLMTAQR